MPCAYPTVDPASREREGNRVITYHLTEDKVVDVLFSLYVEMSSIDHKPKPSRSDRVTMKSLELFKDLLWNRSGWKKRRSSVFVFSGVVWCCVCGWCIDTLP